MCSPGCSCYQKLEHCNEWDPECAPPCHCKEHLRLSRAKEALAVERTRMHNLAINLARSEPTYSLRYEVKNPECILNPNKCSCTPGGPGGCFPEESFGDGGDFLKKELERLLQEKVELLGLALKDERMPLYPYNYYGGGGQGRTPMPYVDPSDILADEFAVLLHTELVKRSGLGGPT